MNRRVAVVLFLLFIAAGIAGISIFASGRVADGPTGVGAETSSQSSE